LGQGINRLESYSKLWLGQSLRDKRRGGSQRGQDTSRNQVALYQA
jgi:hypothetical protein